jgi:tetraacyldisaccharide 4'-kinase
MKWLLWPFTLIYGLIVSIRNKLFDYNFFHQHEFDVPIISIGNITIGGTGKTPHIEYLIEILKDQFNVATLSRGYKRKSKGFVLANESSSVNDIGDEPKQMKLKYPDTEIAVDANRVKGIKKLLSDDVETDIKVILLDDAYQHRYVKPGYSILLVDYNRPITKDHLIPVGRLREQAHEKRRANIILITKSPSDLKPIERRILVKELNIFPYQTLFFTYFKYTALVQVFNQTQIPIENFESKKNDVLLVTGIAKTKYLIEYLDKYCNIVDHIEYSDHHYFNKKELEKIVEKFNQIKSDNKLILTTEKDAVRLMESDNEGLRNMPMYFIQLKIQFLNDDKETFDKMIMDYVKRNKKKKIITEITPPTSS